MIVSTSQTITYFTETDFFLFPYMHVRVIHAISLHLIGLLFTPTTHVLCYVCIQVLLRAMGEAGIAEINAKDKKAREAAKHAASEAMVNGGDGGEDEDKTDF